MTQEEKPCYSLWQQVFIKGIGRGIISEIKADRANVMLNGGTEAWFSFAELSAPPTLKKKRGQNESKK